MSELFHLILCSTSKDKTPGIMYVFALIIRFEMKCLGHLDNRNGDTQCSKGKGRKRYPCCIWDIFVCCRKLSTDVFSIDMICCYLPVRCMIVIDHGCSPVYKQPRSSSLTHTVRGWWLNGRILQERDLCLKL